MEVVLLERVEKLGQMGDVVNVKAGFARNFLLPRKKALRASKANLAYFESQKAQLEAANLKRREEAQAVADKMTGLTVLLVRQAAETGLLYGSVTARDIAAAIREQGYTLDRGQVRLDQPIKSLGATDVDVSLHPEVKVSVKVSVARSEEEARLQTEDAAKLLEHPEELEESEEDLVDDYVEDEEEAE